MSRNDTTGGKPQPAAQESGRRGEDLAAGFLQQRGLSVLARNYRCRGGEIDLVCRDGRALVFVEVRLRRNGDYGGAAASITPAKQRRVILAAKHYLAAHGQSDTDCRIDCLLLEGGSGDRIEWLRDAFAAD